MATLVAAMTRTSVATGLGSPTGWTSCDSEKTEQLRLNARVQLANFVQQQGAPAALRMTPGASSRASVNAPRRWPKS